MGTLSWIIAGLVLGVATPFLLIQVQRRRDVARATVVSGSLARREARRPANPFAAVSVRPGGDSPCRAALESDHVRHLAVRAPRLPLPGCDRAATCSCRYIRHADRRRPVDRRDAFARYEGMLNHANGERRSTEDRRRS